MRIKMRNNLIIGTFWIISAGIAISIGLSACSPEPGKQNSSSIGITTPKDTAQSVAYAYAALTIAVTSVNELLNARKIPPQTAESALEIAKQVKISLDLAAMYAKVSDESNATKALVLANESLKALQKFTEISK